MRKLRVLTKNASGSSVIFFVIVFTAISVLADTYYRWRVAQKDPGSRGEICYSDFRVFWYAGYNLRMGGRVYDRKQKFYHFRYSPFAALLMVPFGKIHRQTDALTLWYFLLNIFYLAALLLVARQLALDFDATTGWRLVLLWGMFLATMRFYLENISLGQTDIIIAFLFALFLISYVKNRQAICGLLLALIFQFKLFFLPILAYFLFAGRKKIVLSAALSFAALLFIPAIFVGAGRAALLLKEWANILGFSVPSQILNHKNQSVTYAIGVLLRMNPAVKTLNPQGLFYALGAGFTLAAYALLLRFGKGAQRRDEKKFRYLEVSLLIAISLLFSPITWRAHFMALVIPAGVAISLVSASRKKGILCLYLGFFFILSCVLGTDLTKFVPLVNNLHFVNIAAGVIFLVLASVYAFLTQNFPDSVY